jgi:ribonuclease J
MNPEIKTTTPASPASTPTGARTESPRPSAPRGGQGGGRGRSFGGRKSFGRGGQGGGRGGRGGGRSFGGGQGAHVRPVHHTPHVEGSTLTSIPPLKDGDIRIIPLGGVEEIGKNMTMIEYKDDIIVMDAGFAFENDETPGVDYLLPDTRYLEERKSKIRAMIITHGHLDHIGGIPYILDRIGNPPVYTRNLTAVMIKKRQEEFPHLPPIDIRVVENDDRITIGGMSVRFFGVTHTIPDSMGIILETPYGILVNPGDYKLDHEDGIPTPEEDARYKFFDNEKVLFMMCDSTNVDNPGFSTPEKYVYRDMEKIISGMQGRLIIGTFSSQIARIIKFIEIAERYGKKVAIDGRSMKTNVEIVKHLGMLKATNLISVDELDNFPPERVLVMATGAQGDEFASLMRMATKTHKNIKITPRDTVLLSASVIPGNERSVAKLKDNLARQGAKIMTYRTTEMYLHSTGHGNRGELEWLHKKIKPKYFMPVHGSHYMLRVHAELAKGLGMTDDRIIVPDNGTVIEIQENGEKFVRLQAKAPSNHLMVDGFSIGDMQEVVLRDRQVLADEGIFIVFAIIDEKTGRLKKSPDIISRGFVYLRESQELLREARFLIKKSIERTTHNQNPINFDYVKSVVTDDISRFLFQQTAKRPVVIPVLLAV